MIPAADIAAARARVDVYGEAIALKRQGAWLVGRCCFHEDHIPSFAVKDGRWICWAGCGRGDTIEFIRRLRNLSFAEAVRALLTAQDAPKPQAARRQAPQASAHPKLSGVAPDAVRRLMQESQPITETTAAAMYLMTRGLPWQQPALRAHARLYCAETGGYFPGMLAPLTDEDGKIIAVQRYFLVDRIEFVGGQGPRDSRAPVQAMRKTLGAMGVAAVRLGIAAPGPVLGIAESVEKAIAASLMFRVAVWAACGASRLGSIWLPPEVRNVLIMADNDEPGQRAAEAAAAHYGRGGRRADILAPDPGFKDFDQQYRVQRGG
jgi:hypothetical protein